MASAHKNQAAIASPLRTNDATNRDASQANDEVPLFRLPRELRDGIQDLVVVSESAFYYNFDLEADRQPHMSIFATGGANAACRQLRIEYTAAVERRVKRLMARNCSKASELSGPDSENQYSHTNGPQLEVSWARCGDTDRTCNIRTITISLPVLIPSPVLGADCTGQGPSLFLTSKYPSSSREHGPRERLRIRWKENLNDGKYWYAFPSSFGPSIRKVTDTAKAVSWKGCIGGYMLWQSHFVRFARVVEDEREWWTPEEHNPGRF